MVSPCLSHSPLSSAQRRSHSSWRKGQQLCWSLGVPSAPEGWMAVGLNGSSHFGIYWGYVLRRKHAFSLSVATGVSRPNSCCYGWRHASFDRHEAGEVSIAKLPDVGTQGCSQHAVSSPRIASHFCVVMVYLCNNTYSLED